MPDWSAVLFQPHSDDAILFATGLLLRYDPMVVTVLSSKKQEQYGITQKEREAEDEQAFSVLGLGYFEQWVEPDTNPDWSAVEAMMIAFDIEHRPQRVFAPEPEEGGHDQHNMVGELALKTFGHKRLTRYLTYRRGSGHSDWGTEVELTPEMIEMKLRALACYRSQIDEPSTRPWFYQLLEMREWVA